MRKIIKVLCIQGILMIVFSISLFATMDDNTVTNETCEIKNEIIDEENIKNEFTGETLDETEYENKEEDAEEILEENTNELITNEIKEQEIFYGQTSVSLKNSVFTLNKCTDISNIQFELTTTEKITKMEIAENEYIKFDSNNKVVFKKEFEVQNFKLIVYLENSGKYELSFSINCKNVVHNWNSQIETEDGDYHIVCKDCKIWRYVEPYYAPFTDVRLDDWFYETVKYVYENKLILGYGGTTKFGPNDTITRAMFVTIIWRCEGSPDTGTPRFPDVNSNEWYYGAVNWAASKGIINGYGNGFFGPNDALTREQLATILNNYAIYKGKSIVANRSLADFPDYTAISGYAYNNVEWAIYHGIIHGKGNMYIDPLGRATRAEAAAMLMNYLNAYDKMENVISEGVIDEPNPTINYMRGQLKVSGWIMNTIRADVVKIYIDDKYVATASRKARQDVIDYCGAKYGGVKFNPEPGYFATINTTNLSNGVHTVKVVDYRPDGTTVVLQKYENFNIVNETQRFGIDVSHYQENINWQAVKNAGVEFAILKIGEYRESTGRILKDSRFDEYYNACKAHGIAVGGYFYSYAFNADEASREANACLSIITGKSFEMPIFIDVEDKLLNNIDKTNLTNASITFCEILRSSGYDAGVYASKNFFYNKLNTEELEKYNIWLAHYTNVTDYIGKYDIWQFTSNGSISGINGAVDLDWCFKRYY